MILVRDIRLPLSAGEPQAFEKALHLARIPRSKAANLGVARLSVDARHGQPKLVYTIAVTLKDEGEESAYAGASPCVAIRVKTDLSVQNGTQRLPHRPEPQNQQLGPPQGAGAFPQKDAAAALCRGDGVVHGQFRPGKVV